MPVPARVSIVTLGVADLAASTAFYDALGWSRSSASDPNEIVWFRTADSALGLFPYKHLADDATLPADGDRRPDGFGGITLAINVEQPELVGEALDAAEAAGGRIVKPAAKAEWGGVSGYFTDPDGYPWEVCWNPYLPLDERGHMVLPD